MFVVLDGTATFETASERIAVDAGEAIRFAPGEYQSGWNAADIELVLVALGAPRDDGGVRVPRACPCCGHEGMRPEVRDGEELLVCPARGIEEPTHRRGTSGSCSADSTRPDLRIGCILGVCLVGLGRRSPSSDWTPRNGVNR
ncbi:hypothetical protein VB779_14860 [Haloarculaceae archaeon H-GB11]|nr:hypothetical protein [Haloarculaceae archaeon H-GB1-1]MEA5388190.1 hypothetical protein [Haloarculaceae archaeon H-GB11]